MKKCKMLFSTQTDLMFNDKCVLITAYKGSRILINKYFVDWPDIKNDKFQFMNDNITNLNLIFKKSRVN